MIKFKVSKLMEKISLQSKDGARADIYIQGAHVSSWVPANGQEQLFLSKASHYQSGVAIRGGVPIIFPQFAQLGNLPKHGFARTAMWQVQATGHDEDGAAYARFSLNENSDLLRIWPHVFNLEYQVSVTSQALLMELHVLNNGDTPFEFTTALHTYCHVDDMKTTKIHGLGGLQYRDALIVNIVDSQNSKQNKKQNNQQTYLQEQDELIIEQEVDRIYVNASETIAIEQTHHRLEISQTGFQDAVVWNPWVDKAAQLKDLSAQEYQHFICVEAAAIMQAIQLLPQQSWRGSQKILCIPT